MSSDIANRNVQVCEDRKKDKVRTMRPNDLCKSVEDKLLEESSLRAMRDEKQRFDDTIGPLELDPRFNSVNWMFDCFQLVEEIGYSYCWMSAYAAGASNTSADAEFHVQYYADNCITRINSFRDKAALLAWAYYCAFNPNNRDEMLGFDRVLDRLRCPIRFGLTIKHQKPFVEQLERLCGQHFDRARDYRHRKIHRMEPKILLRPPRESDGLSYVVPLIKEEEIKDYREKLKEM